MNERMIGKQFAGSLVLLLCASAMVARGVEVQDKQPERQRRYADGPLKLSDFQKRSGDGQLAAYTAARVVYRYRYRSQTQNGQTTVGLTSINFSSVFLPDESWRTPLANDQLLDHEQGHFDIAEACARRAQLKFNQMLQKNLLTSRGQTESEALRRLIRKIEQALRPVNEDATLANQEYDRITHHGRRPRIQAEQRHLQKATLERLAKQLKPPSSSAGQTTRRGSIQP